MFTRHRLSPANKLDCPHAWGLTRFTNHDPSASPSTALRASAKAGFRSGLRRPLGASTFCCYHRPIRLLRCAQSLRAGSGCLPRMQPDESSSQGGTSHPKIAKSAILGWGTAAQFQASQRTTTGYVSDRTAPLKPKAGLSGHPSLQVSTLAGVQSSQYFRKPKSVGDYSEGEDCRLYNEELVRQICRQLNNAKDDAEKERELLSSYERSSKTITKKPELEWSSSKRNTHRLSATQRRQIRSR